MSIESPRSSEEQPDQEDLEVLRSAVGMLDAEVSQQDRGGRLDFGTSCGVTQTGTQDLSARERGRRAREFEREQEVKAMRSFILVADSGDKSNSQATARARKGSRRLFKR